MTKTITNLLLITLLTAFTITPLFGGKMDYEEHLMAPLVGLAKSKALKTGRKIAEVLIQNELFWELIKDLPEMKAAEKVDKEEGCTRGGSLICETTIVAHELAEFKRFHKDHFMLPLVELAKSKALKTGRNAADVLLQNELFWELIESLPEMKAASEADREEGCMRGGSIICETTIVAQELAQLFSKL